MGGNTLGANDLLPVALKRADLPMNVSFVIPASLSAYYFDDVTGNLVQIRSGTSIPVKKLAANNQYFVIYVAGQTVTPWHSVISAKNANTNVFLGAVNVGVFQLNGAPAVTQQSTHTYSATGATGPAHTWTTGVTMGEADDQPNIVGDTHNLTATVQFTSSPPVDAYVQFQPSADYAWSYPVSVLKVNPGTATFTNGTPAITTPVVKAQDMQIGTSDPGVLAFLLKSNGLSWENKGLSIEGTPTAANDFGGLEIGYTQQVTSYIITAKYQDGSKLTIPKVTNAIKPILDVSRNPYGSVFYASPAEHAVYTPLPSALSTDLGTADYPDLGIPATSNGQVTGTVLTHLTIKETFDLYITAFTPSDDRYSTVAIAKWSVEVDSDITGTYQVVNGAARGSLWFAQPSGTNPGLLRVVAPTGWLSADGSSPVTNKPTANELLGDPKIGSPTIWNTP